MKQLLIGCMFLLPCFLQGQVTVYNSSLRDTTKHELYCGLNNHNDIVVRGLDSKNASIRVSSGEIKKLINNTYRVTVKCQDRTPQKDTLFMYGKGKLVKTQVFDVKPFRDYFYFQLGARKDTALTIDEIVASPSLQIKFPSSNYKDPNTLNAFVAGFFMLIVSPQSEIKYSQEVNGNQLSSDDIKKIKTLQPGDIVIIGGIKVTVPTIGTRHAAESLTYKIK